MARIHPHGLSRVTAHFHWHPSLYFRLTGLTALLKRSFTTLCFRKTEVIDASMNCTAMVHLPGKRALFCIIRNAAATRCERSAPVRSSSVSYRLCRWCVRDASLSSRRTPPSSPSIDEILRSHLVRHAVAARDAQHVLV